MNKSDRFELDWPRHPGSPIYNTKKKIKRVVTNFLIKFVFLFTFY